MSERSLKLYRGQYGRFKAFVDPLLREAGYPRGEGVLGVPDSRLVAQYLRYRSEEGASFGVLQNVRTSLRYVASALGQPDPWDAPEVQEAWRHAIDVSRRPPPPPPRSVVVDRDLPEAFVTMIRASSLTGRPKSFRDPALLAIAAGAGVGPAVLVNMTRSSAEIDGDVVRVLVGDGHTTSLRADNPALSPAPPLQEWLRLLEARIPDGDALWYGLDKRGRVGGPLTRAGADVVVRSAGERAGLSPTPSLHALANWRSAGPPAL